MTPEVISRLIAIQDDYCWTIGSTLIGDHNCSIWERRKWRDRGRVVINATGSTFEEAVDKALSDLISRGPHLRSVAERFSSYKQR